MMLHSDCSPAYSSVATRARARASDDEGNESPIVQERASVQVPCALCPVLVHLQVQLLFISP